MCMGVYDGYIMHMGYDTHRKTCDLYVCEYVVVFSSYVRYHAPITR